MEITRFELMQIASEHYLIEGLPDNFNELEESEQNTFLEENAWEPFEYHSGNQVIGFIDSMAYGIERLLRDRFNINIISQADKAAANDPDLDRLNRDLG